ncbi:retron St85 family RNA-directed DNA polymerase [Vibrio parahaemolyticus]|nr:RNA-directed DNA polymerase [Vibrio parahaemolyticus]EGQ9799177.1 RNA-directed DNA polymerase [Vibrio parahaemolyticus]EIA0903187.1 retron St85 family RNA-directed DNA polymerase [Vibrio parahaemolyticus]EIK4815446.1 retron St85 family RNA-directed DNA polymerase [Vibrio parahaemolyticus]EJG1176535.1 retron St85 family RNA-directed DNA polymerase [Vibrio parahaemolyticus]
MHHKIYSKLQLKLKTSRSSIDNFALNSPKKYKVYTIPKRTAGFRVIAHPSRELKCYQRHLVEILTPHLKNHSSSIAYTKEKSIRENALIHVRNDYLLKMDFNDFFNSITPELFFHICRVQEVFFSQAEERLLTKLLFWSKSKSKDEHLVLSVGAPSSPLISNFTMYTFDELITSICHENGISYTRYADDITFSTNRKNILFSIPSLVKSILLNKYEYKITINDSKTVFSSKAHNRHVTGITLNNEGQLSLGRNRKRMLSSMIHKEKIGSLSLDDFTYMRGLISFAKHIEPAFIFRMRVKYGNETVDNIIKGVRNVTN